MGCKLAAQWKPEEEEALLTFLLHHPLHHQLRKHTTTTTTETRSTTSLSTPITPRTPMTRSVDPADTPSGANHPHRGEPCCCKPHMSLEEHTQNLLHLFLPSDPHRTFTNPRCLSTSGQWVEVAHQGGVPSFFLKGPKGLEHVHPCRSLCLHMKSEPRPRTCPITIGNNSNEKHCKRKRHESYLHSRKAAIGKHSCRKVVTT